ncbi:MAG TPA: hypothetical protein DCQ93_04635, partial [Bacteroidetes bacterium]|nr:hypothetical protein [Bacteroidota bacterium]
MNFLRGKFFLPTILFLLIFFHPEKNFSQVASKLIFHRYTEDEGLLNQNIICLLQDSRGFIWAGSTDGLFRFDGYHFKVFRSSESDTQTVSQNFITSLAEDSNGNIWIGTNGNGLCCYNQLTERFSRYQLVGKNSLEKSGQINSIACTADGKIFATCDRFEGIYYFNKKQNKFSPLSFTEFHQLNFDTQSLFIFYGLTIVSNNIVLASGRSGLYKIDLAKKNIFKYNLYNHDPAFAAEVHTRTAIKNIFSGNYMVGTWGNGVEILDTTLNTVKDYWSHPTEIAQLGSYNIVEDMEAISAEEIFVIQKDYPLSVLNTKTNSFTFFNHNPDNEFSVPEGACHCVMKDRAGIYWFGFSSGLASYNPQSSRFHNFSLNDSDASVYDITESISGDTIFLATVLGSGLELYDKNGNSIVNLKTKLNDYNQQNVFSCITNSKGNVFVTSSTAWYEFNAKSKSLTEKIDSVNNGAITGFRIVFDAGENKILLQHSARTVSLINTLDDKLLLKKRLAYPLADSNQVHLENIYRAPNGNFWGVYDYALIEYSPKLDFVKAIPIAAKSRKRIGEGFLTELVFNAEGDIYLISTDGNFTYLNLKTDSVKNYSSENIMAPVRCSGLARTADGIIWISSERGISRFDPASEKFELFDKRNGLPANQIEWIKSMPSGRVYYLFQGGWGYFHSEQLKPASNNAPIFFTFFKINETAFDGDVNSMTEIVSGYNHNNFSFDFSLLDFKNPYRNTYAYQLEGSSDDWITTSTRNSINFSSLPPGNYLLKIKAWNAESAESTMIRELKIIVTPPFWQTWWFRSFIVFLVAVVVYLLFRLRIRIVKREEILKANYQKKISELEVKALRAQMNPHFIFNCLNSINSFILRNDSDVASEYLTKFSRLIRLVLDNSRSTQISLSSELECLKLFIEMEEMRFSDKFEYSIHVNEKINTETIKVPPLILQPYVENSIWHGLLHKSEKGKLKIDINQQNNYIICVIEDNGIG